MKKILPIKIDNYFITECWSYFRFAIIDAYPELTSWKFQNYNNIFSDNKGDIFYGRKDEIYDQFRCYNEVLLSKGYSNNSILEDDIINFLKEQINNDSYVLLECNYSRLFNEEDFTIHEILLYGYDDEKKVFYSPIIQNNQIWKVEAIEYEKIYKSYRDIRLNNKYKNILLYKRFYHYPITVLTPKRSYTYREDLYLLYIDLARICSSDKENLATDYLACYAGLIHGGKEILKQEKEYYTSGDYRYEVYIKKLLNYRCVLFSRIKSEFNFFNLSLPKIQEENIVENLTSCCNLAIKYNLNSDITNINKILKLLDISYKSERIFLNNIKSFLEDIILNKKNLKIY